jgi:hypothetical protein
VERCGAPCTVLAHANTASWLLPNAYRRSDGRLCRLVGPKGVGDPDQRVPDSTWLLARANELMPDLIEVSTGKVLPLGYSASFLSGSLK